MRLTREERETRNALIVAEYRAGDTMTEIGLRHGLSHGGVKYVVTKALSKAERKQLTHDARSKAIKVAIAANGSGAAINMPVKGWRLDKGWRYVRTAEVSL